MWPLENGRLARRPAVLETVHCRALDVAMAAVDRNPPTPRLLLLNGDHQVIIDSAGTSGDDTCGTSARSTGVAAPFEDAERTAVAANNERPAVGLGSNCVKFHTTLL